MRWTRGAFLIGVATLVAGCNLSSDVQGTRPVGIIRLNVVGDSEHGFSTRPTGAFLRIGTVIIPSSGAAPDSCVDSVYTAIDTDEPIIGNVSAGASIAMKSDLGNVSLQPVSTGGGTVYQLAGATPLPLTPGKAVSITTPGEPGGFPAMMLDAVTATPFTFGPINPEPQGDLQLTWAPVQDAGSALVIALQYSSSPTQPVADRMIYCGVRDDGSFTVTADLAQKWKNSSASARKVTAYRWRTSAVVENSALFAALSHYVVSKSSFP
jgi:hypothetical protein